MPARHVRFSSNNTFHSPPTQPPPLMTSGVSSSISSSGPRTPPPLSYAGLPGPMPFARRRSSDASVARERAHEYIALSTAKSLLRYDVSLHPSSIFARRVSISSAALTEPAVYPPQPALSLVTPHLPWAIGVPASNGVYVTVSDVLNSIYHALRVNATQGEFNALGSQKLMRRHQEKPELAIFREFLTI